MVVLSNCDGCAIARSDEAKSLGIAMGEPFFQFKQLVKKHGIYVLSSNYALYGDMSSRVIDIIIQTMPEVLVYSIDEAFLDLTSLEKNFDIVKACQDLVHKIAKKTGIPVSIGIGATKTISKVASHVVKQNKALIKVCYLKEEAALNLVLSKMKVSNIWGVRKRSEIKLNELGIFSGLELKQIPDHILRKYFTIVLARTVTELKGKSVIEVRDLDVAKKQIMVSRSFTQKITAYKEVSGALANHVTCAAEKLRAQQSLVTGMIIFLQTNQFSSIDAKYKNSCYVPLVTPSNNTCILLCQAKHGLASIFRKDFFYKKVGVILTGLINIKHEQLDMFECNNIEHSSLLMNTIDTINLTMGKSTIKFASQGLGNARKIKAHYKTPAYTTSWEQLPIAYAK